MPATKPSRPSATATPVAAASPVKTVLIVTLGTSPAVLTETVWALAHPSDPRTAVVPDEIEILTTQKGKEILDTEVIRSGVWKKLRDKIVKGGPANRLVLRDCTLVEAADLETGTTTRKTDVRSSADTAHTADTMLGLVKKHAGARLIASISGGRKSMSALLYGVMSVAGKHGDRIVHVVSDTRFGEFPPREFFFPGQGGAVTLKDRAGKPVGKPLTCADLRSELADLPFVPLGEKFAELRENHADFAALVGSITGALSAKVEIRIRPAEIVFAGDAVAYADLGMSDANARAMFTTLYRTADFSPKARSLPDQVAESLPEKLAHMEKNYVSRKLSDLRGLLKSRGWPAAKIARALPDIRKWATHHEHTALAD